MSVRTIEVKGMSCQHCVNAVTQALSALDGVKNVTVDLAGAKATFEETKPVPQEAVRAAISRIGFELGRFIE